MTEYDTLETFIAGRSSGEEQAFAQLKEVIYGTSYDDKTKERKTDG